MLTVSMPTRNTPPRLLDRAVKSVLDQDVDLRLVVVNDGGQNPSLHDDPRLTVRNLQKNRGRYFCDAAVLAACDTPWFAVHDADDWSEPCRYRQLVDGSVDGAAFAPYWRHRNGTKQVVKTLRPGKQFTHLTHWAAAVFTVERLRAAGGIHPGFRVGYDTMLLLMVALTGPVGFVSTPTYHYERRHSGSLMADRSTNSRSQLRIDTRARLRELWEQTLVADSPVQVIRDDIGDRIRQVEQVASAWT